MAKTISVIFAGENQWLLQKKLRTVVAMQFISDQQRIYLRPSRSLISRVERLWRTTAARVLLAVPCRPSAGADDDDDEGAVDADAGTEGMVADPPAAAAVVASNTSGRPPEKRDDDRDSDGDRDKGNDDDEDEDDDSKPHARMSENCNRGYHVQTERQRSNIELCENVLQLACWYGCFNENRLNAKKVEGHEYGKPKTSDTMRENRGYRTHAIPVPQSSNSTRAANRPPIRRAVRPRSR